MTTLYTKADDDAFLAALLRVIEGQVRAAMVDHKEWNLPPKAARSIAKRVCGDVAANWSRLDAVRGTCTPRRIGEGSVNCLHVVT